MCYLHDIETSIYLDYLRRKCPRTQPRTCQPTRAIPHMLVECVHDAAHSYGSLMAGDETLQLTHFTAENNILLLVWEWCVHH